MMKIKEVKQNQLFRLILVILPGSKYLSVPADMFRIAWQDSWLAVTGLLLVDFVCFACLVRAIAQNRKGLNFNEILEKTLTKFGAKIVYLLLLAFFLLRFTGLLLDFMELMQTTLTIKTNWVAFVIPILLICAYPVFRGFNNIARTNELIAVFVILSGLGTIVFSMKAIDFRNLAPMLEYGVKPVFTAMEKYTFWFSDSLFLLFLTDKVKKEKHFQRKMNCGFLLAASLVVVMTLAFLGIYGNTAWLHTGVIAKVSQFNVDVTTNGRLDWLSLLVWLSSVVVKCMVFLYCMVECLKGLTGKKGVPWVCGFLVCIGLCLLLLPLYVPIENFLSWRIRKWKIFWLVEYLLPLSMPFLVAKANKKTICYRKKAEAKQGKEPC